MIQYHKLINKILANGEEKQDRTGTGTLSLFGEQMKFDMSKGFPLLTTKKLHVNSIVHELLWFLKGDTNVKYLQDNKVRIWNEWADKSGNLGRVYGAQWRDWKDPNGNSVDQITKLVFNLRNDPNSRRHLVVAYNPGELDQMALPPCHAFFQAHVQCGKLSLQLYQRSADLFLGVPFNIASYALLLHMLAHVCNLKPDTLIHTIGDAHIYKNHIAQCKLLLSRPEYPLPTLELNKSVKNIFDFKRKDITIKNYRAWPSIKGEVSV